MTSKKRQKEWEGKAKYAASVHKPVPPYTWRCHEPMKAHLMIDAEGIAVGYVGYEVCGCDPMEHDHAN